MHEGVHMNISAVCCCALTAGKYEICGAQERALDTASLGWIVDKRAWSCEAAEGNMHFH